MKTSIIVVLTTLVVLLTACSGSSNDTNVDYSDDRVKIDRGASGWCPTGTKTSTQAPNLEGGLSTVELTILGIETITIGNQELETCHSKQEATNIGVELYENWRSKDGLSSRTTMTSGGETTTLEGWQKDGKQCLRWIDKEGKVGLDSCQ